MAAELGRLTAAVIGASGTGSIVIEQLARLGEVGPVGWTGTGVT
jgi:tRNA A37 threonylcarbamoyladenosine dehydratase